MLNRKAKGSNAERELVHMFWAKDWGALRVAGSGSMRYPAADIVAGNGIRRIVVECKALVDGGKYIEKDSIEKLKFFAAKFSAEPWIGLRFNGEDWLFVSLEDMIETKKNFGITEERAKTRGLSFDEVIKG